MLNKSLERLIEYFFFKYQVTCEKLFVFLILNNLNKVQFLVVGLVGMTAFKIVTKARNGKFKQNILL